jgi:exodeoxyribonuclease VII large subunit
MLRINAALGAMWRDSTGGFRHVDTFHNSPAALDADGRSVYRLSGQSQIILA